jgi:hypothetical protein
MLNGDGTKIDFCHQLLMLSLAYRHRAAHIVWNRVKQVREHSNPSSKHAFLRYVRTLLLPK